MERPGLIFLIPDGIDITLRAIAVLLRGQHTCAQVMVMSNQELVVIAAPLVGEVRGVEDDIEMLRIFLSCLVAPRIDMARELDLLLQIHEEDWKGRTWTYKHPRPGVSPTKLFVEIEREQGQLLGMLNEVMVLVRRGMDINDPNLILQATRSIESSVQVQALFIAFMLARATTPNQEFLFLLQVRSINDLSDLHVELQAILYANANNLKIMQQGCAKRHCPSCTAVWDLAEKLGLAAARTLGAIHSISPKESYYRKVEQAQQQFERTRHRENEKEQNKKRLLATALSGRGQSRDFRQTQEHNLEDLIPLHSIKRPPQLKLQTWDTIDATPNKEEKNQLDEVREIYKKKLFC